MLDYVYSYIVIHKDHLISIILDKVWLFVVFSTLGFVVAYTWKGLLNYVNNRWRSNLKKYEGHYFCYRWAGVSQKLVEPTVDIYRSTPFSPFRLRWSTQEGVSTSYPLTEHNGREIYAYGKNNSLGSYSLFILHPTHSSPVNIASGIYTFVNMSHMVVSGPFMISRHRLTREQVETLMPPSSSTSDQADAYDRIVKYEALMESTYSQKNRA